MRLGERTLLLRTGSMFGKMQNNAGWKPALPS